MEEAGRLQSMGSIRVGHNWATSLSIFTFMHWRRKWHPTLVLLPGKSHGRRSLVGYSPWGHKQLGTIEAHFHFQAYKRNIFHPWTLKCKWMWSRSVVSDSATPWLLCPWDFPGKNTGVGSLPLLQGIFPTQGLNLALLHCRQILYQLSHQGSQK